MKSRPNGFTLIELLMVVAIIGILAAIAVPNMLEAQARGKVSRVVADLRSTATAVESYRVDNAAYPPYSSNRDGQEDIYLPYSLTSPVAYLSSFPTDPFNLENWIPWVHRTVQYRERDADRVAPVPYKTTDQLLVVFFPGQDANLRKWVLFSWGPDQSSATDEGGTPQPVYDPTNGTVSTGEIVRAGP